MTDPVLCPNGHPSDDRDYCSTCGVRIGGAPSTPAAPAAATPAPVPAAATAATDAGTDAGTVRGATCPHCDTELDPDNRFCEVCGYDPSTGSLPEAPVAVPATDPPDDDVPDSGTSGEEVADAADSDPDAPAEDVAAGVGSNGNGSGPATTDAADDEAADADADAAVAPAPVAATGTWIAVITADRDYYDRNGVTEVPFPLGVPPRTIELPAGGPVAIGRRSRSRGTNPAIDLAGPPEDAAVSHTHASLLPADDGGWELVDHGSTNGTYLNESPHPVAANEALPIASGDRIYVGAWTKITLELRS